MNSDNTFEELFPLQAADFLPSIMIHTRPDRVLSPQEKNTIYSIDNFNRFCFDAFVGGEMIGSWLLEHPEEVRNKRVADIGSGSGIVAIAAARCGGKVTAIDSDEVACEVIARNAVANGVGGKITIVHANALEFSYAPFDVITAGDVFYSMRQRIMSALLIREFRQGKIIFAGAVFKNELTDFSEKGLLTPQERKSFTRLQDGYAVKLAPA